MYARLVKIKWSKYQIVLRTSRKEHVNEYAQKDSPLEVATLDAIDICISYLRCAADTGRTEEMEDAKMGIVKLLAARHAYVDRDYQAREQRKMEALLEL